MNDIGIDARLSDISIISTKVRSSPLDSEQTALVPAWLQKGWMGSWQDRNESPGGDLQLLAEHFVKLAGSSDNALSALQHFRSRHI
jgi:hypothetical protein